MSTGGSGQSADRSRLLQALLDNLPVVVWEVDTKGVFTFHDGKKGLEAIGMKPGQLLGMNIFDVYAGEGSGAVRAALDGKANHSVSDGDGRVWESWMLPLYEGDTVNACAGVTLDVTEISGKERELRTKLDLIERQQEMIRNLSAPILETWEHVLTLPMVGIIDSARISEIAEDLLSEVVRRGARFAILDLTSVEGIDTTVAANLISLIKSIRLLGAEGIISGIHPRTAQTMIAIGADLGSIPTYASLKQALRHCIEQLEKSEK